MKTTLKLVLVIALIAFSGKVSAQKPLKMAHINMQELVMSMPEHDSAMVQMQKVQKEIETEMESQQVEYNKKLEEYSNNEKNWTDLVRQSRAQELQSLGQRMQIFRESAQQRFEEENENLLRPILDKANKAIETVSKEQGITYVLNTQTLVYRSMDSQDIIQLVKDQLGIKK